MTADEQEAESFRYVAPRIMILSSGNIAVIPMIGRRRPVQIYTPKEFSLDCLPNMEFLEAQHAESERLMRSRQSKTPKPLQPNADDLA